MVKQTLHFRKDSGMNVKMIGRDKSDKVVFSHELQDVKLNTDVPADRFVFKAPPGVEVMDMTQQEAPTEPGQP
jgi:outer membrane lipoprotein-sorting protein